MLLHSKLDRFGVARKVILGKRQPNFYKHLLYLLNRECKKGSINDNGNAFLPAAKG